MITATRLREILDYDPYTGYLIWKKSRGTAKAGTVAGHIATHSKGPPYRVISIARRAYYVHRLIWLWHTGSWPIGHIKHINGRGLDNRIQNLQDTGAPAMPSKRIMGLPFGDAVARPLPLIYDYASTKEYIPSDVRDDPRLERDHTRNARAVTSVRRNSWAAMAKKKKV
jgi:hypothetical protein